MTYDPTKAEHIERNQKYQKKWYAQNKQKQQRRVKEQKLKAKELIRLAKERGKCKCGQNHPAALDFHHRDKEEKLFDICNSWVKQGINQIQQEIDKCDLVCASCHRILHFEENNNGL